jgi:hypothetical protein
MTKKLQRPIALFVVFAFLSLLQLSAMPLPAEQSPGQTAATMNNSEQGPSFVEEEGSPAVTSKKSIVPIILIGVGVAAVAAVLILVVLKTKYDIVGSWTLNFSWAGETPGSTEIEFKGDKKSGDAYMLDVKFGTYTVDGKKVQWVVSFIATATYIGEFTDKTHMSGTMTNNLGKSGTWTAVKAASAAAAPGNQRAVVGLPTAAGK